MLKNTTEVIVLGGGCFWCLDASYKLIKGITKIEPGYSGGYLPNPTEDQVYAKQSGHAEVIRLTFDPAIINLSDILNIFFTIHDPTTKDRQGLDVGSQYRSVIFYLNNNQKPVISSVIKRTQKLWDHKILTEVAQLTEFYPAASYHKDYEINRPDYCQLVINPKLAKLRQQFSAYLQ